MTANLAREARELLPCPFCGSRPIFDATQNKTRWALLCTNGSCRIRPETGTHSSRELAIMAWNTRLAAALDGAPAAPDGLVERLRDAVRDEAGSQLCCWSEGGGTRSCGKDFGRPCLCMNVADAVVAALPAPTPAPEPGVTDEAQIDPAWKPLNKFERKGGVVEIRLMANEWWWREAAPSQDAGLITDAQALARRAENWMANGVIQKVLSEALSPFEIKMLSDVIAALKAAPEPLAPPDVVGLATHIWNCAEEWNLTFGMLSGILQDAFDRALKAAPIPVEVRLEKAADEFGRLVSNKMLEAATAGAWGAGLHMDAAAASTWGSVAADIIAGELPKFVRALTAAEKGAADEA